MIVLVAEQTTNSTIFISTEALQSSVTTIKALMIAL